MFLSALKNINWRKIAFNAAAVLVLSAVIWMVPNLYVKLITPKQNYNFNSAPQKTGFKLQNDNSKLGFKVLLANEKKPKTPEARFVVGNAWADFSLAFSNSKNTYQETTKDNKDTIIWKDSLIDTDFIYLIKNFGLKEEIILRSDALPKSVAKEAGPLNILFNLTTFNVFPKKDLSGNFSTIFHDRKTGEYRFHIEKPYMVDAQGARNDALSLELIPLDDQPQVKSTGTKYMMKLKIPKDWLLDPKRAYPVTIDPTITHNTTALFAATGAAYNRIADFGSGSSPLLESTYHELPADANTAGLWHMNEASGNVADSSGNGNTGTVSGTSAVTGVIGNGRSFNGSTEYINCSTTGFSLNKPITLEAWAYFNVDQPASNYDYVVVASTFANNDMFSIAREASTNKVYYLQAGTVRSGPVIPTGVWTHLAMVFRSTAPYVSFYMNGKEETITQPSAAVSPAAVDCAIGWYRGGAAHHMNGKIDEVKISNIERTPEEIKQDAQRFPYAVYTSPVIDLTQATSWTNLTWAGKGIRTGDGETPISTTGLVAQWNFNETSGTAAASGGSCGSSCNGTLTNMTTSGQDAAATSGWTANNKRWGAGAVMFNGSNNYITIPDNAALNPSQFSLETWFNLSAFSSAAASDIVVKGKDSLANSYRLRILTSSKVLYGGITDTGGTYRNVTSDSPIQTGQWYHAVLTWDGTTSTLYLNGVKQTTTATGFSKGTTNAEIMSFGKQNYSGYEYYFNGIIDATRLYSRAITQAEILANYQSGQIEFQTRTSADNSTWEAWKPTTNETALDSMDDYTPTGCSGGTSVDNGRAFKFTTSGTFTCTSSGNVDVLVVAGGGGGGMDMGGGGGGGGVIYNPSYAVSANTPITVTVGAGGAGAPAAGTGGQPSGHQYTVSAQNGQNSVFGSLTSIGGGRGGSSYRGYTPGIAGANGGSGGGSGGYNDNAGTFYGGTGTAGQGYRGGNSTAAYYSGGGGGAGGQGGDSTGQANGGIGFYSTILGPGYYWGGGGGGSAYTLANGGNGGAGGGGGGSVGTTYGGGGLNNGSAGGGGCSVCWTNTPGGNGGTNTGGGGGGGGHYNSNNKGGDGGSGIVIVRLTPSTKDTSIKMEGTASMKTQIGAPQVDNNTVGLWRLDETSGTGAYIKDSAGSTLPFATGGTITTSGGYTIHTFTSGGTFTPNGSGNVEVLVVGGGGGGGGNHGGGGGGGGICYQASRSVSAGTPYTVTVGNGGVGEGHTVATGTNGGNSAFGTVTALGGGHGGSYILGTSPTSGGSGAGGTARSGNTTGASATQTNCDGATGYGNAGGNAVIGSTDWPGGGGGGAGAAGQNAQSNGHGGNGGNGLQFSISGTASYYAGGGGGGGYYGNAGYYGTGGLGGGGNGGVSETDSVAGTPNTGGGGGGQRNGPGKNGGSGIVIVRYPTATVTVYNHGTPSNTTVVDGFYGKARSFNGTSDIIDTGNTFNTPNNNFTYSLWVKPAATQPSAYADIFGNHGGGCPGGNFCGLGLQQNNTTTNQFVFVFGDGSAWQSTGNFNLTANVWQYVAVTKSSTSGAIVYVNGVNVASIAATGNVSPSTYTMKIGQGYVGANARFFNGVIDEFKIDNVVRSAEEIAESYRAGRDTRITRTISSTDLSSSNKLPFYVASDRPGRFLETIIGNTAYANYEPDANTVGLWRLEEQTGSGAYIKDSSGYANNATPTGTTFAQGQIGKARSFNGSTQYIEVPDSNSLDLTSAGTIELWAYKTAQTSYQMYLTKGHTQAYQLMDYGTTGQLVLRWGSDANNLITDEVVPVSVWTHIAGVYDGSTLKIYINGRLSKSVAYTTNAVANTTPLRIGARDDGYYFTGSLDEVRVSNIARSAADIRAAYEVGKRTHSINIDFVTAPSGAYSSGTTISLNSVSGLYVGDTMIISETTGSATNIEQRVVSSISGTTVTLASGFSNAYSTSAKVFKWQREYMDLTGSLTTQRNAVTKLTLRVNDGSQGANVWLDDFRSNTTYINDNTPDSFDTATGIGTYSTVSIPSTLNRYFQYRAILSSWDTPVSPQLTSFVLNYVSNNPPAAPTITAPANGATNASLTPVVTMYSTDVESNNIKYKLQIATDSGFTQNLQTLDQTSSQTGWTGQNGDGGTSYTTGSTATYTFATPLSQNTVYYIRAYGKDPLGGNTWGTASSTFSFTTTGIPGTPTLSLPANTDYGVAVTNPVFRLSASDNQSDNLVYKIIVCTDSAMTQNCQTFDQSVSTTNWSATSYASGALAQYTWSTTLTKGQTYYWRGYAKDTAGSNTWSSVSSQFSFVGVTDCQFGNNVYITSDCTFSGTVSGADTNWYSGSTNNGSTYLSTQSIYQNYGSGSNKGTITVDGSSARLRVNTGQTIAVGKPIIIKNGGKIVLSGGKIAIDMPLWYVDADHDGYPGSLTPTINVNLPGANYTRAANMRSTTVSDCNDSTSNANNLCGFGNGSEGDKTASGTENVDDLKTAISSTSSSGQTVVNVSSSTGFANGQDVLVIQMTGTGAGNYEIKTVSTTGTGTITLTQNLTNSYGTGGQVIRLHQWNNVTVPSGATLTASAWNGTVGGVVAFEAAATVNVQSGGTITATNLGFTGGSGASSGGSGGGAGSGGNGGSYASNCGSGNGCCCGSAYYAYGAGGGAGGAQGGGGSGAGGGAAWEGVDGAWCENSSVLGTGGTGGAGGMGSSGSAGGSGSTGNGSGGGSAGTGGTNNTAANFSTSLMGGGGGGGNKGTGGAGAGGGGGGGGGGGCGLVGSGISGTGGNGSGGAGGNGQSGGTGGGIIMIYADSITNSGSILANGSNGTSGSNGSSTSATGGNGGNGGSAWAGGGGRGGGGKGASGGNGGGGGGGGSGGAILLKANSVTVGTTTSTGGSGGSGGSGGTGGAGGTGANAGPTGSTGSAGGTGTNGGGGKVAVYYRNTYSGNSNPAATFVSY